MYIHDCKSVFRHSEYRGEAHPPCPRPIEGVGVWFLQFADHACRIYGVEVFTRRSTFCGQSTVSVKPCLTSQHNDRIIDKPAACCNGRAGISPAEAQEVKPAAELPLAPASPRLVTRMPRPVRSSLTVSLGHLPYQVLGLEVVLRVAVAPPLDDRAGEERERRDCAHVEDFEIGREVKREGCKHGCRQALTHV